jgi:ubiquinone/menaquinone biosynthesis C-methylase UbiE
LTDQSISFDRAASFYDETRGFPDGVAGDVARLFGRVGNLSASSRIIEPGVGTGRIALPLANHTGAHIVGVDIAAQMLRRLRAKRADERLTPIHADATAQPFPDEYFDAAVMTHVFHLIPNWEQALDEVGRVLKPGGVLLYAWTEYEAQNFFGVWQQAITAKTMRSPFGTFRSASFLDEAGWRAAGEIDDVTYHTTRTPAGYIDTLRNRVWSSTWRMSDAEIAEGVRLLKNAAAERGLALDEPVQQQVWFKVAPYTP